LIDATDRLSTVALTNSTYYYLNGSTKMVILRCVGPEAFFREKVVLPLEQFVWSCPTESRVDLWSCGLGGPELLESFEAEELSSIGGMLD
jgi:Domain of unknown function (DUF1830)